MKKSRTVAAVLLSFFFVCNLTGYTIAQQQKDRKYYEERGEIVWEAPTESKVIALTFDDGPDPTYTPQIADLLKQYNAKGTFFVVGSRVEQYPTVIDRLIDDGHELGNHTYTHPDIRRISSRKLQQEMIKTSEAIYNRTRVNPHLFRPPGGVYNESIVHLAKKTESLVVMWSWHQDTRDWTDPGTKKIVDKVLLNAKNGDIVLFHDYGGQRNQTVEAIRQILPELQSKGFEFVTVTDLLKIHRRERNK